MKNDGFVHSASGAVSGILSGVIVCPLDIVKFRLQNQLRTVGVASKYNGILGSLMTIIREEGVRGWYRGLGATVQVYMVDRSLWFPLYHFMKHTLTDNSSLPVTSTWVHLGASTSSSALVLMMSYPLWLVRTRIMVHSSVNNPFTYHSLLDGLKTIKRTEGWKSLYKGLVPSFVGISHVAVQFPLYEQLKLGIAAQHKRNGLNGECDSVDLLLAVSASKLVASAVTYPHEVVRIFLQTQTHRIGPNTAAVGVLKTTSNIIYSQGFLGLYKGFFANLCRTVPAAAISISSYELLVRLYGRPDRN